MYKKGYGNRKRAAVAAVWLTASVWLAGCSAGAAKTAFLRQETVQETQETVQETEQEFAQKTQDAAKEAAREMGTLRQYSKCKTPV